MWFSNFVVCRFPRNFSNRLMVSKMILRLGFVDLVDHIASSVLARLVALSELNEPSGGAHLVSSYVPLSQCKRQVVCCRERLHVTALGKIASLSLERNFKLLHQKYRILKAFSSILVWRDPWFCQIAWSSSHTAYVFHGSL